MADGLSRLLRGLVIALVIAVTAVLAWVLFVLAPTTLADLLGVVLVLVAVAGGARIAARVAGSLFPDYNVAEVAVEGPITRDGSGVLPAQPGGTPADDVVEQLERADEDGAVAALLVKLNTPGGEVGASDDIRRAAQAFDGPTVAYTTDTCASGGYWIASGCDELWARDTSVVGSIGVLGSRVTVADLADRLGISYERLTAGEYKDAGFPLKDLEADEREYLQGLIDASYDRFVERVAEGRELDPEAIRDTEARVYLGERAHELGLVDELGPRRDVEERLEAELGEPVTVETFDPTPGLAGRLRRGTAALAGAAAAGAARALVGDRDRPIRLR